VITFLHENSRQFLYDGYYRWNLTTVIQIIFDVLVIGEKHTLHLLPEIKYWYSWPLGFFLLLEGSSNGWIHVFNSLLYRLQETPSRQRKIIASIDGCLLLLKYLKDDWCQISSEDTPSIDAMHLYLCRHGVSCRLWRQNNQRGNEYQTTRNIIIYWQHKENLYLHSTKIFTSADPSVWKMVWHSLPVE